MQKQPPQLAQLATWLAITTQLYDSRMSVLLGNHGFTPTQFATLSHLARNGDRQHTISELTASLEVNQPGVTKIVKKLADAGLVQVTRDPKDARKRFVSITKKGGETMWQVQREMAPDVAAWFADWEPEERTQFLEYLQKLGGWLDGNRLA